MQGFRQTSVGTDTDYHLVALSGVGATNEDARDMHHWFVAYIDPGAGSLIVQATIASIVAIPFFLRRQISRALRVLARLDVRSDSARRPVDPSS